MSQHKLIGRKQLRTTVKYLEKALKSQGYTLPTALADIIDNSIDAGARNINIHFTKAPSENPSNIMLKDIGIVDDGRGMDIETLSKALDLGSETEHESDDLGVFGVGLKTAALAIGDRLVVLSKTFSGEVLKGIIDLEEMRQTNEVVKHVLIGDESDKATFAKYTNNSNHGTIVYIDTNLKYSYNDFNTELGETFGTVYRHKMKAKQFQLTMSGDFIEYDDFLLDDHIPRDEDEEVQVLFDEVIELEDYDEETDSIVLREAYCKVVELPDFGVKENKRRKFTRANSGFSFIRHGREITRGHNLKLWSDHIMYSRIRGEIHFKSDLDKLFGIPVHKDSISPTTKTMEQLQDKLKIVKSRVNSTTEKPISKTIKTADRKTLKDSLETMPSGYSLLPSGKSEIKFAVMKYSEYESPVKINETKNGAVVEFNQNHVFYKKLLTPMANKEGVVQAGETPLVSFESACKKTLEIYDDNMSERIVNELRKHFNESLRLLSEGIKVK